MIEDSIGKGLDLDTIPADLGDRNLDSLDVEDVKFDPDRVIDPRLVGLDLVADPDKLSPKVTNFEFHGSKVRITSPERMLTTASRRRQGVDILSASGFDLQEKPCVDSIKSRLALYKENHKDGTINLKTDIKLIEQENGWNVDGFITWFKRNTMLIGDGGTYNPRELEGLTISDGGDDYFYIELTNGTKFFVHINPKDNAISIYNHWTVGKERHTPPALESVPISEQIASLAKANSFVLDLCKSLRTNGTESQEERNKTRTASYGLEYNYGEVKKPGEVSFDDIGGYEEVKLQLENIAKMFARPEVLKKWGVAKPQGILLHGPPGTGKTLMARALSHEIGADMQMIDSSEIYDKWVGGSEKNIKAIFDTARKAAKTTVVFFDEFDSIIRKGDGSHETSEAVAGIFKRELNTLADENPNVIIVAATNVLGDIDSSLIRAGRFDYRIEVPLPNGNAREQIIQMHINRGTMMGENIFAEDVSSRLIAENTDGLSGADLVEIIRRLKQDRVISEINGHPKGPITSSEFDEVIADYKK